MVVFEFFLKKRTEAVLAKEEELELGFLARGNNALWKKKRLRSFFQPKVFGCTKSYGGSLRLSRLLLWLFIVLLRGALDDGVWRVGEHQFSSAKCPRSFHCGEHFPSSPFSQATIALRKKKAIVVKRFSISRQLARATTVSIHMHATIYTKIS